MERGFRKALVGQDMQSQSSWWKFPGAIAIALVLMVGLVACGSDQVGEVATEVEGATTGTTAPAQASTPPDFAATLPRLTGKATVVITVKGKPIEIEVDGDLAPITAGNFVDLVQKKVYDNTIFHRVVRQPTPFVVQGGDPQSKDPNASPERFGTGSYIDPKTGKVRLIPLEIVPEGRTVPVYSATFEQERISAAPALSHSRGAVAMARSQAPDSASAQFYIALADLQPLDGSYAVFGYVTQGMDVVDTIEMGDRIDSAVVTSGIENLKQTSGETEAADQ